MTSELIYGVTGSFLTDVSFDFYKKKEELVKDGIDVNISIPNFTFDDFNVDAVINTGIAGSLHDKIEIADVVLSEDVLHHDMDATGFGYPKGQIPRMDVLSFKADPGLVALAKKACEAATPEIRIHTGRIVSGDQFVSDTEVKKRIVDDFAGLCTEMEGAAIAQTAHLNNIPFVIIRTISDKADNSATVDYPTFEKKAIANEVKIVKKFCTYFNEL